MKTKKFENVTVTIKTQSVVLIYKDGRTAKVEALQKISKLQSEVEKLWSSLKTLDGNLATLLQDCLYEDVSENFLFSHSCSNATFLSLLATPEAEKAINELLAAKAALRKALGAKPRGSEVALKLPAEAIEALGRSADSLLWVPVEITNLRVKDLHKKVTVKITAENLGGKIIVTSVSAV